MMVGAGRGTGNRAWSRRRACVEWPPFFPMLCAYVVSQPAPVPYDPRLRPVRRAARGTARHACLQALYAGPGACPSAGWQPSARIRSSWCTPPMAAISCASSARRRYCRRRWCAISSRSAIAGIEASAGPQGVPQASAWRSRTKSSTTACRGHSAAAPGYGCCSIPAARWVLVDSASAGRAEEALNLLREGVGTFPVIPLTTAHAPAAAMTSWLSGGSVPEGFALRDECELREHGEQPAVLRCKGIDLTARRFASTWTAACRLRAWRSTGASSCNSSSARTCACVACALRCAGQGERPDRRRGPPGTPGCGFCPHGAAAGRAAGATRGAVRRRGNALTHGRRAR
jgi:hypothetical protein